jgi:NAD(P)-dependent dehydrogenase (short-subunit alcohol dehydrogenase family)
VSSSVPLYQRYGTAAEVASVVLWLLSSESEYVSGALHLIDGALNA